MEAEQSFASSVNPEQEIENTISSMRDSEEFLDVNLRCQDGSFGIQKLVLIMHSEYYRQMFLKLDALAVKTGKMNASACIILQDVEPLDIVNIITYMYDGKVSVMQSNLPGFLSIAEQLRIDDIQSLIPDVSGVLQNRTYQEDQTQVDVSYIAPPPDFRKRKIISPKPEVLKKSKKSAHKTDKSSACRRLKESSPTCTRSHTVMYKEKSENNCDNSLDSPGDSERSCDEDEQNSTRIYKPASGTWIVNNSLRSVACHLGLE